MCLAVNILFGKFWNWFYEMLGTLFTLTPTFIIHVSTPCCDYLSWFVTKDSGCDVLAYPLERRRNKSGINCWYKTTICSAVFNINLFRCELETWGGCYCTLDNASFHLRWEPCWQPYGSQSAFTSADLEPRPCFTRCESLRQTGQLVFLGDIQCGFSVCCFQSPAFGSQAWNQY